jgi:phosphate transport system protein
MERHFDREFEALKQQILVMGTHVQEAISLAMRGLTERELKYLDQVHEIEKEINQLHLEVDSNCIRILAKQSPLGANLRMVFSVVKINADLERMGDQAVNIAHNGKHYLQRPAFKPLIDLPQMGEEVKLMVREALEAFVNLDVALAEKVLRYDDVVDDLKKKILTDVVQLMKKDVSILDEALNLIFIARNLERLGDHATNIAEEAIFDANGTDVRHKREKS